MNKLQTFWKKFSTEIKSDYQTILLSLLLFLSKKLFSCVSQVSPNNKGKFIILSNDAKLNELIRNVASPADTKVEKTQKSRTKKVIPKKTSKKV